MTQLTNCDRRGPCPPQASTRNQRTAAASCSANRGQAECAASREKLIATPSWRAMPAATRLARLRSRCIAAEVPPSIRAAYRGIGGAANPAARMFQQQAAFRAASRGCWDPTAEEQGPWQREATGWREQILATIGPDPGATVGQHTACAPRDSRQPRNTASEVESAFDQSSVCQQALQPQQPATRTIVRLTYAQQAPPTSGVRGHRSRVAADWKQGPSIAGPSSISSSTRRWGDGANLRRRCCCGGKSGARQMFAIQTKEESQDCCQKPAAPPPVNLHR